MLKVKVLSLAAAMLLPLAVNAQPAAQDWELTLGGQGHPISATKATPNANGMSSSRTGGAMRDVPRVAIKA